MALLHFPLFASLSRPSAAAPRLLGARLRRLGGALPLAAALMAAPACAAAEGYPQGASYAPYGADETFPSQPAATRPVQVEVRVSAQTQLEADEYDDTDPSALIEFYRPLAPYGTWVDDPSYGRVWVPSWSEVGLNFAPYQTDGHWALTDDGEWLWVSDYAWGHIPFHYGRWIRTTGHGWAWIPGRAYAPAWVVWRVGGDGYVGWSAMPPTYAWRNGVAVSLRTLPPEAYVFCPTTHVFHDHVDMHVVRDRDEIRRITRRSRTYRPALPTAGTPERSWARPDGAERSSSYDGMRSGGYRPASPSLVEIGIPSSDAPRFRGRPDPRALAYSRKAATPSAHVAPAPVPRLSAPPAPSGGDRPQARTLHAPRTPAFPAPTPEPRVGATPHVIAPPRAAAPRVGATPRVVATPHVGATPTTSHAVPHHAPSVSAPRPMRPATPAPHASATVAKPPAIPSAPSSPARPRIRIPSSPAAEEAAPAPASGRPQSR
ncbi:DUF6600 domain-containing protein [Sorangium sp. So ce1504]|uniref:DUF6600 domain-containing protein n=1 Tax=Sorangium sp. So ce1504 TaxID=3133337 RepID=UPI003F632831